MYARDLGADFSLDDEGGVGYADCVKVATNFEASLRKAYASTKNQTKRRSMENDLDNAVRPHGRVGFVTDIFLESHKWNLTYEGVNRIAGKIQLWHGLNDDDVPMFAAHAIERALREVLVEEAKLVTHYVEGESHSMIRRKWIDVLLAATSG